MRELTARDLRAVLDVVYEINAMVDDGDGRAVPSAVLARLTALLAADGVSYNEVDLNGRRLIATELTAGQTDLRQTTNYGAMLATHPAFGAYARRRFGPGQSVALSDLLGARQLRELPLYREVYRPAGVADHLLVMLRDKARTSTLLTINRAHRGFSDRHRAVAELVAAHLVQAVDQRARRRALAAAARMVTLSVRRTELAADRWRLLTSREQEVVGRLAAGDTDREIGRILGISPRTVHKHLESVYRKLEVGNRTGAIAAYHGGVQSGDPVDWPISAPNSQRIDT